ncbi:unnamed protein product [Nezara viridula]|uniref:Ubiquitin thioesterase OTU n=1 Tax=Nezara viridula TaxID=85310 RepID=A0A9P0HPE4_NEZVI|nr:unnamed protein product [Nezara viridula]
MSKFILKVKTKSGQQIVDNANLTNTILELKQIISKFVNIPVNNMNLLIGFPPKPIDADFLHKTLAEVNIKSGDTLIVEETAIPVPNPTKVFSPPDRPHVEEDKLDGGLLMRQVVPADNSCLFTSVGFVLGGKVDTTAGSYMRQIIAEQVASNEDQYSEAILGKPNKDYCQWILKPESWGGAIELAVLSSFYGIEIAVIDTMNGVINRFGEDKSYDYRVFLIFDGIHYDPLYREPIEPDGSIQTFFLTSNDKVLKLAEELAHEAKTSKQYTDVNRFTLRCLECKTELTGQTQAQQHAQRTGHMNFGEIAS